MSPPSAPVPLAVRVAMAHATVAYLAREHAIDVLHIKGPAIDPSLVPRRSGTDADVLVRPEHVDRLLHIMTRSGWQIHSTFESGSPFGHAATLAHPTWGYADVHRHFPGVTVAPREAFDRLWRDRATTSIAGVTCPVPSVPAQVLLLVLNAARSTPRAHGWSDVRSAWDTAAALRREEVLALVRDLGADVAFAAGTGRLEEYRDAPEYQLWRIVHTGGTRVEEWWARVRAAPDRRSAVRVALRAPLVNTDRLAHKLGHRPRRREVVAEFLRRGFHGAREVFHLIRAGQGR